MGESRPAVLYTMDMLAACTKSCGIRRRDYHQCRVRLRAEPGQRPHWTADGRAYPHFGHRGLQCGNLRRSITRFYTASSRTG
jgi:hypothetical protein